VTLRSSLTISSFPPPNANIDPLTSTMSSTAYGNIGGAEYIFVLRMGSMEPGKAIRDRIAQAGKVGDVSLVEAQHEFPTIL